MVGRGRYRVYALEVGRNRDGIGVFVQQPDEKPETIDCVRQGLAGDLYPTLLVISDPDQRKLK
jgi:hypothetical protein